MSGGYKFLTLNCRGLNGGKKRLQTFKYLKGLNYDIYCLQDCHFTEDMYKQIYSEWGAPCYLSYATSNARGVGIFISKQVDYKVHNSIIDENGNYVILDISFEENRMTLVTLYGPNEDKPTFYEHIFKLIDQLGNDSLLVCGDFNLVLDPSKDYKNYKHVNNKKARATLLNIINENQLHDPFRQQFPLLRRYTWRRTRPLQQARLDFFLTSPALTQYVENTSINPSIQSDHSIVVVTLQFNKFKHGKGLWKLNNSLLKYIEYINLINKKIIEVKKPYALIEYNNDRIDYIPDADLQFSIDDQLFLETLLMEIRGVSISYASFKKKKFETKRT